ncbi:MAG: twin-arginine translocation signal domain-containing protein [Actinomycetota bacterium]
MAEHIISRRTFLGGAAALGAAGVLTALDPRWVMADEAALRPFGMAMHIHASFSEGTGSAANGGASMLQQLTQASTNAVDVLWWTEHDWRMSGYGFRKVVHFDALTENEAGLPLKWVQSKSGTLTSSSATISKTVGSPLDPNAKSSLKLSAVGSSSSFATLRSTANTANARQNLRGTLAGMTISIEVFPISIGPNGYLEMQIRSSNHPATGGRPAGIYTISYRIGGPDAPGTHRTQGINGFVTLAAPTGAWTSLNLVPCDDFAQLWPDMQSQDNAMYDFSLAASSRSGATASGHFDFLRFQRPTTPLDIQGQLMNAYASAFPTVVQMPAVEVSNTVDHLNWFGGTIALPDYSPLPILPPPSDPAMTYGFVNTIHSGGGLASYNHMFGTDGGSLSSTAQETLRQSVASKLVSSLVYGADILKVGYRQYGAMPLSRYLSVWDVCSRNAIFTTGTGVSDNHGNAWSTQSNNFLTWAWAADLVQQSLLDALVAGRCFFADMARFRGQLDLLVDGVAPMGSVSVSDLTSRQLVITATGLPTGGTVKLVKGPVDLAGPGVPFSGTTVQSFPATAFATGSMSFTLDTTNALFARVGVWDSSNKLLAGSNPVWLLHVPPSGGIPAARAV